MAFNYRYRKNELFVYAACFVPAVEELTLKDYNFFSYSKQQILITSKFTAQGTSYLVREASKTFSDRIGRDAI